jgi:hypothetical protein
MWRRPGTVQTISTSGSRGRAGDPPTPPGPVSGSIFIPDISSRVTLTPGIAVGVPSTYGSAQFSGSNYLSVAGGSGTAMGTGDFTWECWVYPTSSADYQCFIDTRTQPLEGGDDTGFYFGTNFNTLAPIYYTDGLQLESTESITLNAWNHVALTRNSGTVTLWVNGTSGGTQSNATDLTQQRVFIGGDGLGGALNLIGNISNLRIVKGQALYTNNFTPPTSTLTAVAGTQLLLTTPNNANFLVDSSTNDFTVTNNGVVTRSATTPFIAPSTTPFTVEGWFYSTVTPGTNSGPVLLSTDTASSNPTYIKALTINISTPTQIVVDSNGAAQQAFSFAETMLVNTWYYVAVSRDSSGYIQVWLGKDGDANATASTTARLDTSGNAAWELTGLSNTIGAFVPANRYTTGYISNLRVDSTGLYATTAATIPVPTEPFAELAGTVFLQNTDELTDETGTQTLAAVGSAAGNESNPFNSGLISFTTVGTTTWTAPTGVTEVEYLIVAGGGGGGTGYDRGGGGGGGAGMMLTGTTTVTPGTTYTVVVGDGGTGGADERVNNPGAVGGNSVFATVTALGGIGGQGSRTFSPTARYTGGTAQIGSGTSALSGGGGGGGGSAGGGGGATGAGGNGAGTTGGAGGAGLTSSITGSSVTYSVGGAGGGYDTDIDGANGTTNRGNGGAGGGAASGSSAKGGNGGSGIVVIKYGQ